MDPSTTASVSQQAEDHHPVVERVWLVVRLYDLVLHGLELEALFCGTAG